jgi:hypothetical protein
MLTYRRSTPAGDSDALGPDGAHLSAKGNNVVYRYLKEHLSDELRIGPRTLPPHRPPAHTAAYPDGCDGCDGKLAKKRR